MAESTSLLVKVELRKGDALYLNDGAYGSMFDAAHFKWPFPVRLIRDGQASVETRPFKFFGPTCDSIDAVAGPYWLPEDVCEGDYLEIGQMGAYGVAMATRFNGYGDVDIAEVGEPPVASMFGLGPRNIAAPRAEEEESRKVVRFSRPKGAAGKKRRKR